MLNVGEAEWFQTAQLWFDDFTQKIMDRSEHMV